MEYRKTVRNLDRRDLEILKILQEDGRAPYSDLARRLGISEVAVYSRIKRLVRDGVIKGFTAVLDESRLGLGIGALIGLKATPLRYEEILNKLSRFPEILEIHDVTGDYYAILKVRTRDKESLTQLLDKIGKLEGVISTDTKLILRTIKETTKMPLEGLVDVARQPRRTPI
ncbi:MAG: Lrp/AsnC family transcriptional regulator [Candidatus Caldarchaeales archaeon]|jgi:Lrp/AsnC family transcriptional regulator for asnA, asnC and gidA|nr:Lrp/AsnC family transcriptional regulator [Candidatus Caldarchaeales archaeon]